jgi:hypothetical protein
VRALVLGIIGLTGCESVFPLTLSTDGATDGATADAHVCPQPYKETQTGCYRIGPVASSFGAAEIECETDGGHLVVMTDQTEVNVVFGFYQATRMNVYAYIGLTATRTGSFQWVTVEDASVPPPMQPPWMADEPNDPVNKPCGLLNFASPNLDTFFCTGLMTAGVCEHDGFAGDPSRY